jgi:hypothetical protein
VFALAERHEEANELLVISVVAGFYFGGLARVMAWWTGGSIAGAVFGALGGGFVGMLLGTAAMIPVMTRMGDQKWSDWIGLLLLVSFIGFEVLGTIGGAFYGARRKRRRAV